MSGVTMKISRETHRLIESVARHEGKSMQDVVEQAVEAYRRAQMLRETNQAYRRLRRGRQAWRGETAEREILEGTLADGLQEG